MAGVMYAWPEDSRFCMCSHGDHALVFRMKDGEDMLVEGGLDDCVCFVKYYAIHCIGGHETDGIHGVLMVTHGGIRGSLIQLWIRAVPCWFHLLWPSDGQGV